MPQPNKDFIYSLTNRVTGSIYIGQTKEPEKRLYQHLYHLKRGTSHHPLLQADFDRHGDVYDFEIVDDATHADSETTWINKYDHRKSLNVQKRVGVAENTYKRLKTIRAKQLRHNQERTNQQ